MQRRDFIKGACRICLLGAAAVTVADMAGCSPSVAKGITKTPVINNSISVPLSIFDTHPVQVISPDKYPYEIAIEKKADNSFRALLLKCTHYENQLTPTGNGYTCTAHGSRFDKEGNVLNGPAEQQLKQLKTQIVQDNLLIQL